MGTKTIRLDEDVYERIKRQKRSDETFSEAIDRLTGAPSLAELGGIVDLERVEKMEAAIEAADEADAAEVEEFLDEFR
ncbi:antitoxin VapB family protein [Halovivax sp.]|uniref:antitoxin VapB family protein n=1 Tax=Halovivax sp. TaxID=1935978 RepID=UPI0025C1641C|nr:antitoxin VapB family protein [Halovivax sp.]